jgi:hypothetical protein
MSFFSAQYFSRLHSILSKALRAHGGKLMGLYDSERSGSFPGFNIGTTFVLDQLSGISAVSNILNLPSKHLFPSSGRRLKKWISAHSGQVQNYYNKQELPLGTPNQILQPTSCISASRRRLASWIGLAQNLGQFSMQNPAAMSLDFDPLQSELESLEVFLSFSRCPSHVFRMS